MSIDRSRVRFLDTNIILRFLTKDDEKKARQAMALFMRLEAGTERVFTSPMVIFETVFTLQKFYGVPREQIRDALEDILSFTGLTLPNKAVYRRALDIYVENNFSFADAYNAALMASQGVTQIYTYDTDFDKLEGINRVEPAEG
jgi:uncharacterized protein